MQATDKVDTNLLRSIFQLPGLLGYMTERSIRPE